MKLSEIENLPDQEFKLDDFVSKFIHPPIWVDPNDLTIVIKHEISSIQEMVGVFREDALIALIVLEPYYRDPSIAQLKLTYVSPQERRKGFLRLLISFYRERFGKLCSDEAQSLMAKNMWKALIQQPMGLHIVRWDVETDMKQTAKEVPEDTIWNDESDVVLLVETIDVYKYGNSHRISILEETYEYPTQKRWDTPAHDLFP